MSTVGTPGVGFGLGGEGYFRLSAFNSHRWIGIEPSGHWGQIDQPDRFATEVAGFLREVGWCKDATVVRFHDNLTRRCLPSSPSK